MDVLRYKHPFTCLVAGPTQSGKTSHVRKLLKDFPNTTSINDSVLKVLWGYGVWQPTYNEQIGYNVKVVYVNGLPSEEIIAQHKPHILVLDDLMNELGNNMNLANLFTNGSHHLGISIIFISQNLFHEGSKMRTIGLNCHYYVIMKNPRDKLQVISFAKQVFPRKTKYFMESYEDATSEKHSYIRVDFKQETPDHLRVISKYLPEDGSPIFYTPI